MVIEHLRAPSTSLAWRDLQCNLLDWPLGYVDHPRVLNVSECPYSDRPSVRVRPHLSTSVPSPLSASISRRQQVLSDRLSQCGVRLLQNAVSLTAESHDSLAPASVSQILRSRYLHPECDSSSSLADRFYTSATHSFLANVNPRSRSLYAIVCPSVCRLSVCNARAPYSGG